MHGRQGVGWRRQLQAEVELGSAPGSLMIGVRGRATRRGVGVQVWLGGLGRAARRTTGDSGVDDGRRRAAGWQQQRVARWFGDRIKWLYPFWYGQVVQQVQVVVAVGVGVVETGLLRRGAPGEQQLVSCHSKGDDGGAQRQKKKVRMPL